MIERKLLNVYAIGKLLNFVWNKSEHSRFAVVFTSQNAYAEVIVYHIHHSPKGIDVRNWKSSDP